jgi:hypothetical protein
MWSVSKGIVWRHIWTTWAIGNDYRIRGLRCRSADALRALDTSPWWKIESARSSLWRQSILLMSSLVVSKYFLPFALSPWPPEAADSVCIETPIHPKSSSDSSSNTLRGLEPPLFRFPASSHSFANSLYRTAPTFTYHHSLLHHTLIQTALLPTRPYKCRKPHRMPAVPPVAHIPMSNYATRRSYTGLDPVPENALPSGSRSSTPSIGGSTRVSSRLSSYHDFADDATKPVGGTRPSPVNAPQTESQANSLADHFARVSTDTDSTTSTTTLGLCRNANWLRILYRRFVIFVTIAVVSVILLVVAYYEAPIGGHEPAILWLHIISTNVFLTFLIDQVNEMVKARGRSKKDLLFVYIVSVTVVVSMTATAWTLWGFGTHRHDSHLLLIASIMFKGIDILFMLLLAGRDSCETVHQVRRMLRKEHSEELPEINPHNGPHASFLHVGRMV